MRSLKIGLSPACKCPWPQFYKTIQVQVYLFLSVAHWHVGGRARHSD